MVEFIVSVVVGINSVIASSVAMVGVMMLAMTALIIMRVVAMMLVTMLVGVMAMMIVTSDHAYRRCCCDVLLAVNRRACAMSPRFLAGRSLFAVVTRLALVFFFHVLKQHLHVGEFGYDQVYFSSFSNIGRFGVPVQVPFQVYSRASHLQRTTS